MDSILQVIDLQTHFKTDKGINYAVEGISFNVPVGKILGIVGESGSGKSTAALSIMNLVPHPGRIVSGEIVFNGLKLTSMNQTKMQNIRGKEMAMIFQNPKASLDPILTVGYQIAESILVHQPTMSKFNVKKRVLELMIRVGISDPLIRYEQYPYQLSGGLSQRVMIAIALACQPKLIIADEPTSSLDLTIQRQILELMKDLQRETNTSMIFISHDLGAVCKVSDLVIVMYSGKIVESGTVEDIFMRPKHPYTYNLLRSIPKGGEPKRDKSGNREKLYVMPGQFPDPFNLPLGCRFNSRCQNVLQDCHRKLPRLSATDSTTHFVTCFNPIIGDPDKQLGN